MANENWNPRYLAYAAAHGLSPEAMRAADDEKYPGGKMAGFLGWMSAQWQAWRKEHGHSPTAILFDEDYAAFDRWLAAQNACHFCKSVGCDETCQTEDNHIDGADLAGAP